MNGHATARNSAEVTKTSIKTKAVRKVAAEILGRSTRALCRVLDEVARKFCRQRRHDPVSCMG